MTAQRPIVAILLTCPLATGCAWLSGQEQAPQPREVVVEMAPPPTAAEQEQRLVEAEGVKSAGDYEKALALFREILQENPSIETATEAYVGIGEIYKEKGDYGSAEREYSRAARLSPTNFDAQFGHGVVLQILGRVVDAIKAFHRALSIDPDNFDANTSMASAYLQINEPQSAIIFAEKAVSLKPDDGPTRVNLGAAYEKVGRSAEAIVQYETAMELMDPSPELMMNLVNAYAKENRHHETVNAAQALLRMAPSANAWERLGWAYFRMKMYPESMEAYREGVKLDANHWMSLNGVGVNALNRWLQNRADESARTEARDAFRQSLRVNPAQPKVASLVTSYGL
jgi:tetratricopeptide (TPR) repeat protein